MHVFAPYKMQIVQNANVAHGTMVVAFLCALIVQLFYVKMINLNTKLHAKFQSLKITNVTQIFLHFMKIHVIIVELFSILKSLEIILVKLCFFFKFQVNHATNQDNTVVCDAKCVSVMNIFDVNVLSILKKIETIHVLSVLIQQLKSVICRYLVSHNIFIILKVVPIYEINQLTHYILYIYIYIQYVLGTKLMR